MSRKIVIDTYTFTAAAKTIDMPSVSGLQIEGIQLITNVVDNVIIYQFNNPAKGGTLSGTTLTLTFDTTSMSDADQLMIIYDSPTDSVTQPVSVSGTVTVDGSGVTQPVSGTVTVTQATATNLKSQAEAYQGGTAVGAANPLQVSLANTGANATAVKVDGSAVTQPVSGTVSISGTVTVDGSGVTQPVSIASNVEVNLNDGTGTGITSHTAGASQGIDVAIIDGSGNQITSFGGGTQYTEDAASDADPIGTQLIARRRDSLSAETDTDGDNTAVNSTSKGELYVKHVDTIDANVTNTVNVSITSGGGTEYTEGDVDASFTGPVILGEKPTNTAFPLQLDSSGNLNVNVVTGGTSGTQYAEGDALGSTPTGTLMIGRKFSDDTAEGVTVGSASTKRPIHVQSIDSNGDVRPNATLYQQSDTSNTADLAPGVAWKDADGTGNWHVTSITDPLPTQLYNSSGTEIASATSAPAGTENGLVVRNIPQTKSDTASFTGSSQTLSLTNIGGMSTALISITGTFSATVVPQVSADNGSTYTNVSASPGIRRIFNYTTGGWIYEITATGLYGVNIAGCNAFRLNCAAYTSGTVTVKASVSNGSSIDVGRMNHVSVAISASSSGNNTIVSAISGQKIKVTSWNFISNGSVNAKFTDGAGGSDLTGLYYMIANTGISVPYNPEGYIITSTNTALVLNLSGAIAVGGVLTYTVCDNF